MDLIDPIFKRPGMFFGEHRTINKFACFIMGYELASGYFLMGNLDFAQWLSKKYGLKKNSNWMTIMRYIHQGDDTAFDLFPSEFKVYLADEGLLPPDEA